MQSIGKLENCCGLVLKTSSAGPVPFKIDIEFTSCSLQYIAPVMMNVLVGFLLSLELIMLKRFAEKRKIEYSQLELESWSLKDRKSG